MGNGVKAGIGGKGLKGGSKGGVDWRFFFLGFTHPICRQFFTAFCTPRIEKKGDFSFYLFFLALMMMNST